MATTINADTSEGLKLTSDTSGELELQSAGVTKVKVTANGLQDANGNSITGGMYRNFIINGNMQIAQRGTSATGLTNGGYRTVDRFLFDIGGLGTWTNTQSTDVPSGQGFSNSFKVECTTADTSPAVTDYCMIQQRFEGQNIQHLKKGTSNAESVTLSFWVKSNKTGTYITQLEDFDNTRNISKSYTIDTADTWEKKTITFAGDTTGAFDNDNNLSLVVEFWLGAGSNYTSGTLATTWESQVSANRAVGQVNLADAVNNYINITGVQLEVGEGASDFEFLPYDVQLARCQRYYQQLGGNSTFENFGQGCSFSTTNTFFQIQLVTQMRANPSLEYSNLAHFRIHYPGVVGITPLTGWSLETTGTSPTMVLSNVSTASTASAGEGKCLQLTAENSTSARIKLSAEL